MKILVAVPVFNEEKYVAPVLREIRKYARASGVARVLVINDGSTDATASVLDELQRRGHLDVITHPENRGYGQSLIDAFAWAQREGFDWVITMDCDEQHEPCRIPCFVEACQRDDADIISGSRYLKAALQTDLPPADRRSINQTITEMLNSTLDLSLLPPLLAPCDTNDAATVEASDQPVLTDGFCGFKAQRTAAMARLNLTIPGYAFPMQFWAQAAAAKLRIREIPVRLIYKDATRHFGGTLDDPTSRLQHYLEVLSAEMALLARRAEPAATECVCCCGPR